MVIEVDAEHADLGLPLSQAAFAFARFLLMILNGSAIRQTRYLVAAGG